MKKLLTLTLAASAIAAFADEKPKTSPENFMRSSLYTILLKSNTQNQALVKEANTVSEGAALVKSFAGTDAKRAAKDDGTSIAEAPQIEFLNIAIPDQFNDHNLSTRIISFDEIFNGMSDADKEAAKNVGGAAKKSGGAFGKALVSGAKASVGIDPDNPNANIDTYGAGVIAKYIDDNHLGEQLLAKWFNNDTKGNAWDMNTVIDRGMYGATAEEKQQAATTGMTSGLGQGKGLKLVGNTYIVVTNLRFRSNQAIVKEASQAANAIGGALGVGQYTQLAGMAAGVAAGDGFQVQAQSYLFRLVWNNDIQNKFAEDIYNKKGSFQDLVNSGLVKVEFVGKEKAGSRVRQSITNTTPQNVLTRRATARAIDASIAKLQEKNEVFRTAFPITKVDEEGNLYARVGMKEGIEKDDEYEILEENLNPKTNETEWKVIGKVKAVDKQIMDNRFGAAEEAQAKLEGDASADADGNSLEFTTFKGGKKGVDYSGNFLRLKKKK